MSHLPPVNESLDAAVAIDDGTPSQPTASLPKAEPASAASELTPSLPRAAAAIDKVATPPSDDTPSLPLLPPAVIQTPRRDAPPRIAGYEIIRELGRGGMGRVYLARETGQLRRLVGLKTLLGHTPENIERLFNEARAAGSLNHPNIVPVFHCGRESDTPYYTMQYVEGASGQAASTVSRLVDRFRECGAPHAALDELLRVAGVERNPPPAAITTVAAVGGDRPYYRIVASWIASVADALSQAHRAHILHRDVKPSNLMLARDGRMMLADFGLAKTSDTPDMTVADFVLGTPPYWAPELRLRTQTHHDERTDVYGLGLCLYELLTLERVARDGTAAERIKPPSEHVPDVPRALERICMRALAEKRAKRFVSAAAFADALQQWLNPRVRRPAGVWKFAAVAASCAASFVLADMVVLPQFTSHPPLVYRLLGGMSGVAKVAPTPVSDEPLPVVKSPPTEPVEVPDTPGGGSVTIPGTVHSGAVLPPPPPDKCRHDATRKPVVAIGGTCTEESVRHQQRDASDRAAEIKLADLLRRRDDLTYRPLPLNTGDDEPADLVDAAGRAGIDYVLHVRVTRAAELTLEQGEWNAVDHTAEVTHAPNRSTGRDTTEWRRSEDVARQWDLVVRIELYAACDGRLIDAFEASDVCVQKPGAAAIDEALRRLTVAIATPAFDRAEADWMETATTP